MNPSAEHSPERGEVGADVMKSHRGDTGGVSCCPRVECEGSEEPEIGKAEPVSLENVFCLSSLSILAVQKRVNFVDNSK